MAGGSRRDKRTDVSILVFLDQALKDKGAVPCDEAGRVSILVFLDQALKVEALKTVRPAAIMFQSLFSWIKR